MLKIKNQEQREKIEEVLKHGYTSHWFTDGEDDGVNIDDYISFEDMSKIVDILRSSKDKNKDLFEECWVAYRRKGIKQKARQFWNKLNESEMDMVLPHIKAYVSSREVHFQKDFERYLRDKVFETVVYNGNNIVYDPTRNDGSEGMYNPTCGGGLMYNEFSGCYLYIGWYTDGDDIPDGYTNDSRPDGATIMLNNARGTLVWSRETKTWNRK